MASPHTHACAWNGNNTRIDNCAGNYNVAYQEGTCNSFPANPVGGGTIMSYCHLQAVGINLSLGFGPQPGALIRNTVNAGTCLGVCTECDANVVITGVYSTPLTESTTWIKSSGQTRIDSSATVTLDADDASKLLQRPINHRIAIRPEAIELSLNGELDAQIRSHSLLGNVIRYRVEARGVELVVDVLNRSAADLHPDGQRLALSIDPTALCEVA